MIRSLHALSLLRLGFMAGAAIILLHTSSLASSGKRLEVIGIIDGDTILVTDGLKRNFLHLLGVDAPEKGQPLAQDAKDFVMNTLSGAPHKVKRVNLPGKNLPSCTIHFRDPASGSFRNLSCELLYRGLAFLDQTSVQSIQKPQKYMQSEKHSRKNKRGVWGLEKRIYPWDYRKVFDIEEIELTSNSAKTTRALRHLEEGQLNLEINPQEEASKEESVIAEFYQNLLSGTLRDESGND